MKSRLVILPYRAGSQSAKSLARALGVKRIVPDLEKTKFIGNDNDTIINWGNGQMAPKVKRGHTMFMLNAHTAVANAANKLKTFELLHNHGVPIPGFTTNLETACSWLEDAVVNRVFCRQTLTGHSGRGIVVARDPDEIIESPLYVQGIPKAEEYRIHVMRDTVFDQQQKRAREGIREERGPDWAPDVRSHANGWVFTRTDVDAPKEVKDAAIAAVTALGLDFGAVDVCTKKNGEVFVLEVNTSPGLEGTTLDNYTQTFKKLLNL